MPRVGTDLLVLALALGTVSCASSPRMIALETTSQRASGSAQAALTRSLFEKPLDRANLSEDVIQRIVNAPIDPEFPSRAGVVLLSKPFTRSAYASLEPGDEAPQVLARELERSQHFVMVSDISPYLAEGQHVESLRELATRYRLKYLVVLNTRFVDRSRVNRWGWGWLTLVGIPFLPAYSLRTQGLMEATLLDVRTGTFLFTTQVQIKANDRTTPFGTDEKLADLQRDASRRAARELGRAFLGKCNRLVSEASRRRGSSTSPPTATRREPGSSTPGAPGGSARDGA
jgi:rhombotail lipoprotein